jgi:3-phenylpropionate/cinnamic acid dioxygenase small subunit
MTVSIDVVAAIVALQHRVEQFYYAEAELIDDRRYAEWLELLAEDLHYWMPVRTARLPREEGREFEGNAGAAHFDDDKSQMRQRIRKLQTGRAWSEVPNSRTRHLVANVRVRSVGDGEYDVKSNFFVYRTRSEHYQDSFAGERVDLLREATTELGFVVARRRVIIDQTIILANNISTFF